MPGIHESLDHDGRAMLTRWLEYAASGRFTGTVQVAGRPGGSVQLRDGLAVLVSSPGAPGVQALLVRTGRVPDEAWASHGTAGEHAASRGDVGTAHLRVIQSMANHDALFAILAGTIETCVTESGGLSAPPAWRGEDPAELLAAAGRRLDALARMDRAILPDRERLAARAGTGADALDGLREQIVRYADGRRTARDVAFLSGRGVYAVTVEMSRMLADGLLYEPPQQPAPARSADAPWVSVLPRTAPDSTPDGGESSDGRELRDGREPRDGGWERPRPVLPRRERRGFLRFGERIRESGN